MTAGLLYASRVSPMSKLTPAAAAVVEVMEASFPALETMPAEQGRRLIASAPRPPLPVIEVAEVTDRTIPGPGGRIPVRIFRPRIAEQLPAIVYFHGGGFVIGDLDLYDRGCRALSMGTDAIVVSVDYRLAPEHPFPAAVEDADAARRWVRDHAAELGADPQRIAVAGDSAGGTLAAVTAVHSRAEPGPALRAQLLIYPGVQMAAQTPSRAEFAAPGYFLHKATMEFFEASYLVDADPADPDASPLLTPDLSGLPPAHLVLPECDPLHDEGRAYAARLTAAGVPTVAAEYAGMFHGFFNLGHVLPEAADAATAAFDWLRQQLHDQPA
jgi:acetyl esterase